MRKVLLWMVCFLGAWAYAARDADFTWSEYVTFPLIVTGTVRISPIARESADNCTLLVDGEPAVGWAQENPMWDSGSVADGWHELTLTGGNATANILVVNGKEVVLHEGTLTVSETWRASVAHLVCASVIVPNGKTLTVAEDAEVYYLNRARIYLFGGEMETVVSSEPVRVDLRGHLVATCTERVSPVAIEASESASLKVDGAAASDWTRENPLWDTTTVADGMHELTLTGENVSASVEVLNGVVVHEGTLDPDETWGADKVHLVRHLVSVPAGRRLTIADGATVHFLENTGFRVDGTVVYGNGLRFILEDTAIAANAFNGNTGLSRVTLSSGLTSIGANAFACANLEVMVMLGEEPPTISGNLCPGGTPLLLVPETPAWANALAGSWVFHGVEAAYQEGMIAYRVLPNGNAVYLGYCGEGNAPAVPETLNGHPVVVEEAVMLAGGWSFISPTCAWDAQSVGQLPNPLTYDAASQCYVKAYGELAAGVPLWVYCQDAAELAMYGRPADKVWTLGLMTGWNCVGAAKDVPTLPANATAWEWTQGGYSQVTGGLKAGRAYWVFVE